MKVPQELMRLLENQQYGFIGKHSAVKICAWTKKSILGEGVCYKEKFYGIKCHRCCQMTPSIGYCQNRCIICWRPVEYTLGSEMDSDIDDPKNILKYAPRIQKKLLSGFGGNEGADPSKLKEAFEPMHYAISLSGEPTIYPKLSEMIRMLHKEGKTTFVVTNGMLPEVLERLEPPTQLYLSIDAPTEELLKKVDRSVLKDSWKRLNKSLDVLKNLRKKTRTTLRITLVKGINMVHPEKYAEMIKKSEPMFVEVKAYMWVGASRERLALENMPRHPEVVEFSKQIAEHSGYKIIDEQPESRVVLLMKEDSSSRIMKF
ncbi:4-demethylwyosine synthase TYW1 [Candidatus Woesearchaeota archaeon]|nr:4-demethylwyosine synthase TYW1 [Candidatus Woesearchaeota archaeon]